MAFFLTQPDEAAIQDFTQEQRTSNLSYQPLRGTEFKFDSKDFERDDRFSSFWIDHARVKLGSGSACYEAAVQALKNWRQFEMPWVSVFPEQQELQVDLVVVIRAAHIGFWSLSGCKIVYVVDECDESGDKQRFGFAYGTTLQHLVSGEERFLVEYNLRTDEVFYDVLSFSRGGNWLVRLGSLATRYFQQQFREQSLEAMQKAVSSRSSIKSL